MANLTGVSRLSPVVYPSRLRGTRVTGSVEVRDDQTDLFVGHLAAKVLEDRFPIPAIPGRVEDRLNNP